MLDYNKIEELFGAPLNTVQKPQIPFRLKTWHVVVASVTVFVLYKGIQKINEDYFVNSLSKKEFSN